ncbi:hypothetical protein B0T22DRAFT_445229 [Podospora appendiculata]|uniref:HAUS augmin-like complex subunit 3 N-terminal domain-containing protein n=1 Tax=Podospora appendiculata TaxID=314037 RepID=A0AAE1C7J1_9PEZI|nr:hypothetical protein B0T22DRAFT_445229 [Podospora appendiculata]
MDFESLVRILRKYDASIDASAVKAALSSSQNGKSDALIEWATLHVTPNTLLSVDELALFDALEKSGQAEKLASSADLATVQAFSDQDIKDAIQELNRSTESISKQTENLKQQHEALGRLVNGTRKDLEARSNMESRQTERLEAQRRSIGAAVEELSQVLDSNITDMEQQHKAESANVHKTVDSLVRSDDKLLSSLQKLGWELETEDPAEQDNVTALRETCARLIKFTVEGLRTKLDRIYLESLEAVMRSGASKRVRADEVVALQEELESLYAEILPVAQMSTEQQFLEPALKDLATKNGQGLARSEEAFRYIHDCLDYMLDHISELSSRIEAFQDYQIAAHFLAGIARSELTAKDELPAHKQQRTAAGASPTRRKSTGPRGSLSPVRPQTKPGNARRSSGIGGLGEDSPLDEILRSLAISLPPEENPSFIDVQAQTQALASILADRRAKTNDVARNVQESFEAAATKQIADAKLAIQLVSDSVLAESPFGQVRLMDPEMDASIGVLSQEVEKLDAKLEGVDASLVKIRGRSAKKEELIRRWGS